MEFMESIESKELCLKGFKLYNLLRLNELTRLSCLSQKEIRA